MGVGAGRRGLAIVTTTVPIIAIVMAVAVWLRWDSDIAQTVVTVVSFGLTAVGTWLAWLAWHGTHEQSSSRHDESSASPAAVRAWLPYHSRLYGRDVLLDRLRQDVERAANEKRRDRPVVAILHGLAGVGKSHIAAEYARRYSEKYGSTLWVPAENEDSAKPAFDGAAAELGLASDGWTDHRSRVYGRLAGMKSRWLLILDNADDEKFLRRLIPNAANADVLVTRIQGDYPNRTTISRQVGKLAEKDAVDYLLDRTKSEEELDATLVSEALGYLPLALSQAASYVVSARISLREYHDLFRVRVERERLLDKGEPEHHVNVRTTFGIIYDRLNESQRTLLSILACFAPDDIPRSLLDDFSRVMTVRSDVAAATNHYLADSVDLREALGRLVNFSLVSESEAPESSDRSFSSRRTPDDPGLSVHRLVQMIVIGRLSRSEREWREVARGLIEAATAGVNTQDPGGWRTYDRLVPHIQAAAGEENDSPSLVWAARYLYEYGDFQRSHAIWEKILEARIRSFGNNDRRTLLAIFELARSNAGLGDFKRALDGMSESYLVLNERWREDEEVITLVAVELSSLLAAAGKFDRAVELARRAYEIRSEALGDENPLTMEACGCLAEALAAAGDGYDDALELSSRTLAYWRRVDGGKDPRKLLAAHRYSSVLLRSGRRKQAAQMAKKTWNDCRRTFTAKHRHTLAARENLAQIIAESGDVAKAVEHEREILAVRRATFGENHPDLLAARHRLVLWLPEIGKVDEAVEHGRGLADAYAETFGHSHRDSVISAIDVAVLLIRNGRVAEALRGTDLLRDRQETRETITAGHPKVLAAVSRMAGALATAGEVERAADWQNWALDGYSSLLGEDHPLWLTEMLALARMAAYRGELHRAACLAERVHSGRSAQLGANHPATIEAIAAYVDWSATVGWIEIEQLRVEVNGLLEYKPPPTGRGVVESLTGLAATLADLGEIDSARKLAAWIPGCIADGGPLHWRDTAHLARPLVASGQAETVAATGRRVLDEGLTADRHPMAQGALNNLAVALVEAGQDQMAFLLAERAHARLAERAHTRSTGDLVATFNLAWIQARGRDTRRAMQLADDPDEHRISSPGVLAAMSRMAGALATAGEVDRAFDWQDRALDGYNSLPGKDHPLSLTATLALARMAAYRGEPLRAARLAEQALRGRTAQLGVNHPATVEARKFWTSVTGRPD